MILSTSENLKNFVYDFAKPEGRMVGTPGHDTAKKFIVDKMTSIGLAPYATESFELPYSVSNFDFVNIIGVVKSNFPDSAPMLIGAHYDSVIEGCCADDNAAAVAIALAVGESFVLIQDELQRDVSIAIFDAEEPPYFCSSKMGSENFYENQMDDRGVHSALILDLVGHDVTIPIDNSEWLKSLFFITGAESSPEWSDVFKATGFPTDLRLVNTLNTYVGDMSDHGIFRRNGIPYLFFSCGRWEHYHQYSDIPEKLNYDKMQKLLMYIVKISNTILVSNFTPNITDAENSIQLEIDSIHQAFSPETSTILKYIIGKDTIKSRTDIDEFVFSLLSVGL